MLSAQLLFLCFQATGVDQAAGMSLVVFSLLLFTYYSVWVIVLVGSASVPNLLFGDRHFNVQLNPFSSNNQKQEVVWSSLLVLLHVCQPDTLTGISIKELHFFK